MNLFKVFQKQSKIPDLITEVTRLQYQSSQPDTQDEFSALDGVPPKIIEQAKINIARAQLQENQKQQDRRNKINAIASKLLKGCIAISSCAVFYFAGTTIITYWPKSEEQKRQDAGNEIAAAYRYWDRLDEEEYQLFMNKLTLCKRKDYNTFTLAECKYFFAHPDKYLNEYNLDKYQHKLAQEYDDDMQACLHKPYQQICILKIQAAHDARL
jgi:hypothetical protein